ncbi:MAG: heavy-metal-associated domain-containing protein [Prochloraceae cyanobacterium]
MTLKLKVPSMVCSGCVDNITKQLQTHFPDVSVNIDLETKMVNVDTEASKESIVQVITAAGHTIE